MCLINCSGGCFQCAPEEHCLRFDYETYSCPKGRHGQKATFSCPCELLKLQEDDCDDIERITISRPNDTLPKPNST